MKDFLDRFPHWIFLAVLVLILALIVRNTFIQKYKANETVTVTGMAEHKFESDFISWSGSFQRKSTDLKDAYAQLKADENKIKEYILKKGLKEKELLFSSITIDREYDNRYNETTRMSHQIFTGYRLSQQLKLESADISKVEEISRDITKLIQEGIELSSSEPFYYFTKLSDLKIDLLKKAAEDAKKRAEVIADNAGGGLGKLQQTSMGIFQITAQNSNEEFRAGGAYNTTSKSKTATITIRAEYRIN